MAKEPILNLYTLPLQEGVRACQVPGTFWYFYHATENKIHPKLKHNPRRDDTGETFFLDIRQQ